MKPIIVGVSMEMPSFTMTECPWPSRVPWWKYSSGDTDGLYNSSLQLAVNELVSELHFTLLHQQKFLGVEGCCHGGFVDCPCPISILPHVVVANQALHENTKVRGPGVEATLLVTTARMWGKGVPISLFHISFSGQPVIV